MSHVRIEPLKDPNYAHITCACSDPTPVSRFIGDLRNPADLAFLEQQEAEHLKTCTKEQS